MRLSTRLGYADGFRRTAERAAALEQAGVELCWVADGRPRKPDPSGLEFLCQKLLPRDRPAEALFVGDTADDEEAARAARARGAPLVYAHVEVPGDTTRVLETLLAETGA